VIQWLVFLLFSGLAILSALGVVLLPNPIYVILALLSVLVSVAKEVRHITNRVDEDKSSNEGHYRGGNRGKGVKVEAQR